MTTSTPTSTPVSPAPLPDASPRGQVPARAPSFAQRRAQIINFLFRFQSYFGLLIIFLLAVAFSPVRDGVNLFLSERNLLNVLTFASEIGILAVGMTLVILVGGIDLSVGSIMALIGVISADFLMNTKTVVLFGTSLAIGPLPAVAIFAICIGVGLALGWFNGWTAERFRIPAFVTTLAMMIMARGLAREWAANNSIPIAYDTGAAASQYSTGNFGDPLFGLIGRVLPGTNIPMPVIIMIVCALIFGLILSYTTFGRRIYAVGGNPMASRLSGINVSRLRIYTFMICSALAAVAGMIHASRLNQGSPNESINYELNAIAAVVIGGASLSGGKGTVLGAIGGALILQILDNILGLNNVSSNTQLIVKGLLVIAAVALQQLRPSTETA